MRDKPDFLPLRSIRPQDRTLSTLGRYRLPNLVRPDTVCSKLTSLYRAPGHVNLRIVCRLECGVGPEVCSQIDGRGTHCGIFPYHYKVDEFVPCAQHVNLQKVRQPGCGRVRVPRNWTKSCASKRSLEHVFALKLTD